MANTNATTTARRIFTKWKAELRNKDKRADAVSDNFDELFHELWKASVSLEVAEAILNDAIAAHLPSQSTAKWTYKRQKPTFTVPKTEQEFYKEWKEMIHDKAVAAMHSFYATSDVVEEQRFGSMDLKEYRAQRKYAESFPRINDASLAEIRNRQQQEMLNMEEIIRNVLGTIDEKDG